MNAPNPQEVVPNQRIMANRLFAIGDIHGCNVALRALIEAIDPRPDDTIVVLGDVIDWGPDSRGCVQQLIDLSGRCQFILVRGNHEEMMDAALESQSELRYWLNFGGDETLKSYPYRGDDEIIDREHVRFLKAQALDYHETDEFIFVHASYDPNKPMSQQSNTTLQWEHIVPDQMRPHFSGKKVIAGHTPQTTGEPLGLGYFVCIDTDCSRGGLAHRSGCQERESHSSQSKVSSAAPDDSKRGDEVMVQKLGDSTEICFVLLEMTA